MSKNGIDSLALFDFPANLTSLTLDGNDLTTLRGAVLPATLEILWVTDNLAIKHSCSSIS